jgi:hypothetical protein
MPLSSREAFGLFQQEVMKIGQQAEMLRVGLAGYQQALQENDQLLKENEELKKGKPAAPAQGNVAPFPPQPGAPTQPPQG